MAAAVGAENDFFIRTTDPEHEAFVQRFVEKLRDAGDLYEGTYEGLYCVPCEAFYREEDLVDGNCPQHGLPVETFVEHNTFFRLSAYAERLLALYDRGPTSCCRARASTRRAPSWPAGSTTSPSRAARPTGASRCPGRRSRSSTSGSTRCSTTPRRSRTRVPART